MIQFRAKMFDQQVVAQSSPEPLYAQTSNKHKVTNLEKLLTSITPDAMQHMVNFLKQNRQNFQQKFLKNRNILQRISLYEDILILVTFKENQLKIQDDKTYIKKICRQLEEKIKRKADTIRERICKKLHKLPLTEILELMSQGEDILFGKHRQRPTRKPQEQCPLQKVQPQKKESLKPSTPTSPAPTSIPQADCKDCNYSHHNYSSSIKIYCFREKGTKKVIFYDQKQLQQHSSCLMSNIQHVKEHLLSKEAQNTGWELEASNRYWDNILKDQVNQETHLNREPSTKEEKVTLSEKMKEANELLGILKKSINVPYQRQIKQLEIIVDQIQKAQGLTNNTQDTIQQKAEEIQKNRDNGVNDDKRDQKKQKLNDISQEKITEIRQERDFIRQENQKNTTKSIQQAEQIVAEEDEHLKQNELTAHKNQASPAKQQTEKQFLFWFNDKPELLEKYNNSPQEFGYLRWYKEEDEILRKNLQESVEHRIALNCLKRYKKQYQITQREIFLGLHTIRSTSNNQKCDPNLQ